MGISSVLACGDCNAQLIITLSALGYTSRYVSKYRPAVPQVCSACSAAGMQRYMYLVCRCQPLAPCAGL